MYAAVLCSSYQEKVQELYAYQTIVREARRCGGKGWLLYDQMFRQQAAVRVTDWSKLNSSLYATTFLQQQNGRGRTDHMSNDCSLAPLQPGCLSTQLCMDIPAYTSYQEINYLSSISAIYSQHLYRRSFKKQSSTTVPTGR